MSDSQNFSGIISPVTNLPATCGQHIGWGNAPVPPDPWGFWWDTADDAPAITNGNGTVTTYLPKGNGTSGQVLTSNGATAVPTYQTPAPAVLGFTVEQVLTSGMTAANITTAQTLVGNWNALPAGAMNVLKKHMILELIGNFNTIVAEIPTVTFNLVFATVTLATITTDALTASVAAGAFRLCVDLVTDAIGVAGTVVRSATLDIQLAGTSAVTRYLYSPAASSGPVNLTGTSIPAITVSAAGTQLTGIACSKAILHVE